MLSKTRSLALIFLWMAATVGQAVVVPDGSSPLADRQVRHPDLDLSNVYQPLSELPAPFAADAQRHLAALGIAVESARVDVRGGSWGTLLPAQPLLPGDGVGNQLRWEHLKVAPPADENLEQAAWDAFVAYLDAHRDELGIDVGELVAGGRVTVSQGGDLIQIYGARQIDGVPVRDSFLTAAVSHGNLVLFGAEKWGPVETSTEPGLTRDDAIAAAASYLAPFQPSGWGNTELVLVPMAAGAVSEIEIGQGYDYRLAWVVGARFKNDQASWELLVDAGDGEVLSFADTNHYATTRRVQGGVYPVSNDGIPPDGVEQAGWPMPFETVATTAGTVTTDAGGNLPGCFDGNITSDLDGQFVRRNDNCGAISLTSSGDVDFGTSGGDDCVTPGFGGAGNTHSSRTGFHELNRIKEQGRGQLPANGWLQLKLTANMNINQSCNAFWNGATVNFYRSGGGCANTGELAGVFDHEWGHGMDDNDANPFVSNPGEGIADVYAALRLNTSCIGRGFFDVGVCGGYGDPCISCDGIRDIDFAQRVSGQPHDIAWVNANCPGGSGPCGGAVHCEGAVYAEAIWDLINRDLPTIFGMSHDTAHEVGTRLTYLGGGAVGTWFQCSTPFGGCAATGGYLNFLAADDDNGNINTGTPHMSAIFSAFDRHGAACNTPAVQNSGCAGAPTTAPAVTATPGDTTVDLSWGAVAGATEYHVFRTDGVFACDFGKVKAGETASTSFTDTGLQNGRDYSYVVIPIGGNDTCMGPASSCDTVAPVAGPDPCGGGGSAFQAGTVTIDEIVRTVTLNGFTNPIVVVGPPSHNGGHPSVTRTMNVAAGSFDHFLQEWDYLDGNHTNETAGYLALDAGTATVGNLPAEAGSTLVGTGWLTVNFTQTFSTAPVVVTQVASNNDAAAVTTRVRNVGTGSFQVRLQEEEAADGVHADETVHFIAVEPGSFVGDRQFHIGTSGDVVTHLWTAVNFGATVNNIIFVGGAQTTDGGNTAAVRHRNLTATGVEVEIEEEQSLDAEINHITENVGYIVLGN